MSCLEQRQGRATVADFLNPKGPVRVRDHARDNIVALRERQKENREMAQAAAEAAPLAEWKMKKFRDVKSKIFEEAQQPQHRRGDGYQNGGGGGGGLSPRQSPRRANPMRGDRDGNEGGGGGGGGFLRRGSLETRLEQAKVERRPESPRLSPRQPVKAAVPTGAEGRLKLAPRRQQDFLAANREGAAAAKLSPRKAPPDKSGGKKHGEFGSVPMYLQEKRAAEAEAEERRRLAMPDPNCPAGMTLMPEHERLETLAILAANEKETSDLLFKLPMASATHSVAKRRDALEAKLREIDAAKKVFSKPKVYVQG